MMAERKLFGTFGFRGIVNEDLSPELALGIGKSLGTMVEKGDNIALGYDPRTSNKMFECALESGIISTGANVLEMGMISLPAFAYTVKHSNVKAGIMITASHNPPEWNGIKIFDSVGSAFYIDRDLQIEKIFFGKKFRKASWDSLGQIIRVYDPTRSYVNNLIKLFDKKVIRSSSFKVGIDGGGGANSFISPKVLGEIGCRIFTHNCIPDGYFRERRPEPKFETLRNFSKICKALEVDIGVAHDGDGDRAVFIDEQGRVLQGDRTFALSCYWALKNNPGQIIVTNISTSSVILDVAEEVQAEVELTSIGEPSLIKKMKERGAIVGGEENGGFIYRKWSWARDGILSTLSLLDLMASEEKTLSELDELFPKYHQLKVNIPCAKEKYVKVMDHVKSNIPSDYEKLTTFDGFRVDYASNEWLCIRPSGTEPLIRVFCEAKTVERAEKLSSLGKKIVKDGLNGD